MSVTLDCNVYLANKRIKDSKAYFRVRFIIHQYKLCYSYINDANHII